jgi:hypothetical protein
LTRLIATADRLRVTPGRATNAFDLWKLADEEAYGSEEGRRHLFWHAMIHAGFLLERPAEGDPRRYIVCPVCEARLDCADDGA